jgi:acyl-CoA reductase-like NAD-dependent aldehyde dehydrogenase
MRTEAFIGGRFVAAADGARFEDVSPRDGSVLGSVARCSGNSVVLKPAEQSPLSALALAELAAQAGVPDGVLNVVPGFGEEAGEPLGRHPDVDKIAFTGSVEVGRRFLRYAGESNGKAVSLELGGKSPHVVLADARDLDAAAQAIGWGIFYNAGQTCHAGSRVIVQRELAEPLTERLVRFARDLRPADPADPIIQEEVFGPVLAIQEADDLEQAIALANGTGYGLAAAVWTSDVTTAHRVARRLRAGTVWVNTFDASTLATPFGGVKDSGQGRDRSLHALDGYRHLKTTSIGL